MTGRLLFDTQPNKRCNDGTLRRIVRGSILPIGELSRMVTGGGSLADCELRRVLPVEHKLDGRHRRMSHTYRTGLVEMLPPRGASGLAPARGWAARLRRQEDVRTKVDGGLEIVVEAPSFRVALHATRLIRSAIGVMSGEPEPFGVDLHPYCDRDPACIADRQLTAHKADVLATAGLWESCLLAARASRLKKWQYAITRYSLSQSLFAAANIDLDPSHGPHMPVSRYPLDHLRFAYAIMAAHSVIEDLGLELRASTTRPSRINGEWNPLVRSELENRLQAAGIDTTESVVWMIRGPARVIDKKRRVSSLTACSWARGTVRDSDVALVDAIAHVDWLRDRVAAHAARHETASLSPYDVANAQHLARRLTLGVMGFWQAQRPSIHGLQPAAARAHDEGRRG